MHCNFLTCWKSHYLASFLLHNGSLHVTRRVDGVAIRNLDLELLPVLGFELGLLPQTEA